MSLNEHDITVNIKQLILYITVTVKYHQHYKSEKGRIKMKKLPMKESERLLKFGDQIDEFVSQAINSQKSHKLKLNISLELNNKNVSVSLPLHAELYKNLSNFITQSIYDAWSNEDIRKQLIKQAM